jgi:hypothetical protein
LYLRRVLIGLKSVSILTRLDIKDKAVSILTRVLIKPFTTMLLVLGARTGGHVSQIRPPFVMRPINLLIEMDQTRERCVDLIVQ